jgi:energy-coupling factor transporter ATP-binding protein EcfA2
MVRSETHSHSPDVPVMGEAVRNAKHFSGAVRFPGLTPASQEIPRLAGDLSKRLAVFSYRSLMPSAWVVFLGGTGTGKSTLFNALCGKPLSEMGIERPKTGGPIVYSYQGAFVEQHFPFPSVHMERCHLEDLQAMPAAGVPGHMLILEHKREDWSHLFIIDTPDLDSLEAKNRQTAEDLYLLSDIVVFVTSQEKYADEVPYHFLRRIIEERRPYFLLLNKAEDRLTKEEVLVVLEGRGISFASDRVWLIPYAPADPFPWILEHPVFHEFVRSFSQTLSTEGIEPLRKRQNSWRAADLKRRVGGILELLEEENRAAGQWLTRLDGLYEEASHDLIREEKRRFMAESREHVQQEVRRLFSKYDVLARPRRFIKEIFLTPLRFLGFYRRQTGANHKAALKKVRRQIGLVPVQRAVEKFNRSVLEKLSPSDEGSPLFRELRKTGVVLNDGEIKDRIWTEQSQLDTWVEEKFQKLSRGIRKHKKWGIYSTSALWGMLIICLEIVVGGGFSVLDAALDSALAPFVTKGAVEVFAYQEIQKTARQLAKRYQEGLLATVRHQRDRYEQCLQSLLTSPKTLESLRALDAELTDCNL